MSKVRFIIGGTVADLSGTREFPFKIDYQIEDVNDFTTRKGGGSTRTFKLPGTATNNKIFNKIAVARVDTDLVKLAQDSSIEIDGVPVASGTVRMKLVTLKNNHWSREACIYEVAFLADNSDWVSKMEGRKLAELDLDDHEFNLANWNMQDETALTNDWVYTLIKWKDWSFTIPGAVQRNEYTPALFLINIITKAFNLIGYTVNSTWFTTDFATRLIMPVPLKNYGSGFFSEFTDVVAERTATTTFPGGNAVVIFGDDSTPPNTDPAANYDPVTGKYTAPYDGRYRFRYEVVVDAITVIAGTAGFALTVIVNAGPTFPTPFFFFKPVVNGDLISLDVEVELVAGDVVECLVTGDINVTSFDLKTGNLQVNGVRIDWVFGTDVVFRHLTPDINLTDLIRGFSELFNLYIYGDSAAQSVIIEPRQDFINASKDMTDKVDGAKKGAKSLVGAAKLLQFKYQEDSNDSTTEFLSDSETLPLYAGQYELSDGTATGESEFVNSFFAPTLHILDRTIAGFDNRDNPPQLPLIYPENYIENPTESVTDYIHVPRILYHKGFSNIGTGSEPAPEGSLSLLIKSPTTRSTYPLSFMVNYYNTGSDPSLSFTTETVAYGNTVKGLLELYWLEHLSTINNGVQIQEWFRFSIIDLIQQDFRSRFAIHGDKYIVQKIEGFNPLIQDSTKTIMLEEKCPEKDDIDRLSGSTQIGFING